MFRVSRVIIITSLILLLPKITYTCACHLCNQHFVDSKMCHVILSALLAQNLVFMYPRMYTHVRDDVCIHDTCAGLDMYTRQAHIHVCLLCILDTDVYMCLTCIHVYTRLFPTRQAIGLFSIFIGLFYMSVYTRLSPTQQAHIHVCVKYTCPLCIHDVITYVCTRHIYTSVYMYIWGGYS
jgi:hypothetical protein